MPKKRRLQPVINRDHAMEVTQAAVAKKKLVYVIVVDKRIKYPKGYSKIVYIGTTKKGVSRIARSVAYRSSSVFDRRGVRKFIVRVITCHNRQNVRTWRKLERAMILMFKELHESPPALNVQGKRMKETNEFHLFRRSRIKNIIEELT